MTTLRRRYVLASEVGRGASGAVWRAYDAQLGRNVAIKLLHSDLDPEYLRSSFEQEARTLARLRSPNIVQVFDSGVERGQPFIVMELLDGESLEARLHRHGRLPLKSVVDLFAEIASGISAIHSSGIIHRDLKPANIFLAREPGREVVKLLDFGIAARSVDVSSSDTGRMPLAGTPRYMSPERFEGADADVRSEVWSLGVVLYEMLTGSPPFHGETLRDVRRNIAETLPAPASQLQRELPKEIDAFFERALAQEPSQRFGSVAEMAAELLEIARAGSEPVVRILLVDDERDMEFLFRQKFRRKLQEGSYELWFATDGHAALEVLARHPNIDVILSDILMPGMDGLTFLSKVPELTAHARVVMISAYSDMANIRSAMNRGAYDFLCKPIDLSDLERTIEKTARHVAELRAADNSLVENTLLRSVVGHGRAEQLRVQASALGADSHPIEATVVCWRMEGNSPDLADVDHRAFETTSACWDLVYSEVSSEGGLFASCDAHSAITVFEGDEHSARAVRAFLSVATCLDERGAELEGDGVGFCAGAAAGKVVAGVMRLRGGLMPEVVWMGAPVRRAADLLRTARPGEIAFDDHVRDALSRDPNFELRALLSRPMQPATPLAAADEREGGLTTLGSGSQA